MKFETIDLANVSPSQVILVNATFRLWQDVYSPIVQAAGEQLKADAFYKARQALILHQEGSVLSFSLSNFLDFRFLGVPELSYLEPASPLFRARMVRDQKRVMTIEWVTVNPEFRGKGHAVKHVDLIMGLSFQVLMHSPYDCAMGFSRTDFKADQLVESYGGQKMELTTRHGIECGVMIMDKHKVKPHRNPETQSLIEEIYHGHSVEVPQRKVA